MSENGDVNPRRRRPFIRNNNNRSTSGGGQYRKSSNRGGGYQQQQYQNSNNEKELASVQVQIQAKRFYIDVKENPRGRFIKLAEVGVGGRKSRVLMSMGAAAEFRKYLNVFSDVHASMGPAHENNNNSNDKQQDGGDAGLIRSETIVKDRKRYYLDFKENQRGRFLRISMVLQRGGRAQIAIPAQGLIEFSDQLGDMLERYYTGDDGGGDTGDDYGNPEGGHDSTGDVGSDNEHQQQQHENGSNKIAREQGKSLRADNKTFYFDHGTNQRGSFLRISEVRPNSRFRASITVPDKYLKEFRDQLVDILEGRASTNGGGGDAAESSDTAAGAASGAEDKEASSKKETVPQTNGVDGSKDDEGVKEKKHHHKNVLKTAADVVKEAVKEVVHAVKH